MAKLSEEEEADLRDHIETLIYISMVSFHRAAADILKEISIVRFGLEWPEDTPPKEWGGPVDPEDEDPFEGWDVVEDWEREWGN